MTWGIPTTASVILGSLLFLAQPLLAPAQTSGRCRLAVSVVDSSTHSGLPHALVSYVGPDSGYRFTDAGGRIQVEDASCGYYSLSISKPGFASSADAAWRDALLNPVRQAEFDAEFSGQSQHAFIPVRERVNLTTDSSFVDVVLLPLASIAGDVLDENGEPLEGISVQGIAAHPYFNGVDYVLAQTARTDDRGHYTLFNLVPGDYVVRLAGKTSLVGADSGADPNVENRHRGMPAVYYPGTDAISAGSVLHLAPGERATADFQHSTQPGVDIEGAVAGFVPHASMTMELYPDGDQIPVTSIFVNGSSGRFHASDVSAGTYTLRVSQYQRDPPRWLAAEAQLVVGSESVHDLIIPLSQGANIAVSITYEAGAVRGEPVQVVLQPQHGFGAKRQLAIGDSSRAEAPVEASLRPDSTPRSTLTNVIPGRYRLYVTLSDRSKNYVASVTLGNGDVLRNEFRMDGNRAGDLHVTIRGDSASVDGQVSFQGQPAAGALVYLTPAEGVERTRLSVSDQRGFFRVPGIPPGEFRIRAWVGSPAVADLFSEGGQLLILQPGEHRTAVLDAAQASETEQGRE